MYKTTKTGKMYRRSLILSRLLDLHQLVSWLSLQQYFFGNFCDRFVPVLIVLNPFAHIFCHFRIPLCLISPFIGLVNL